MPYLKQTRLSFTVHDRLRSPNQSVADGEGWSGHTSPLRAKRPCVADGAGPSQTHRIDELLSVGRGQPVGPLAASSDGGGIAADPAAACPVQVFVSLRPGVPAGALRRLPRLRLIMTAGSAHTVGWLSTRTAMGRLEASIQNMQKGSSCKQPFSARVAARSSVGACARMSCG